MTVITLKNKNYQSTLTAPFDIDLGGMIPLMTTTLSSTASSVTFSDIPGYYEHLQIRVFGQTTGTTWGILTFNSDTSTSSYRSHYMASDGSTTYAGVWSQTHTGVMINGTTGFSNNNSTSFSYTVIDIIDYANTNKNKIVKNIAGFDNNSGSSSAGLEFNSGIWINTSKVTTLQLKAGQNNFASTSSFALYAYKGAGL